MQFNVIENTLLTPSATDRAVYYLTLAPHEAELSCDYQPGDWLTLTTENRIELVEQILQYLNLSGSERIELRRIGDVSVADALQKQLEITQLNPAILNKLQRQYALGNWADRAEMIAYAYGRDIIDLLLEFPSLRAMGAEFLSLLSPLAPRYYSIASAPSAENRVSILYKHVRYERDGRQRLGVATDFLSRLEQGSPIQGELKSNSTFKLPENPMTPIVMIGAGTGVAPFIGFMQQRAQLPETGENFLFFGETHQTSHCLCCDKIQVWQASGRLQVFNAFSRDQAQKIYVQHRIAEQQSSLWAVLEKGAVIYICGSQERLSTAVEQSFLQVFRSQGNLDESQAAEYWQALRAQKRIQMDVY